MNSDHTQASALTCADAASVPIERRGEDGRTISNILSVVKSNIKKAALFVGVGAAFIAPVGMQGSVASGAWMSQHASHQSSFDPGVRDLSQTRVVSRRDEDDLVAVFKKTLSLLESGEGAEASPSFQAYLDKLFRVLIPLVPRLIEVVTKEHEHLLAGIYDDIVGVADVVQMLNTEYENQQRLDAVADFREWLGLVQELYPEQQSYPVPARFVKYEEDEVFERPYWDEQFHEVAMSLDELWEV